MNRRHARVWPLYSGVSVTINDGAIFFFKFWTVFSDNESSDDIFLVINFSVWFPLTVSCFK